MVYLSKFRWLSDSTAGCPPEGVRAHVWLQRLQHRDGTGTVMSSHVTPGYMTLSHVVYLSKFHWLSDSMTRRLSKRVRAPIQRRGTYQYTVGTHVMGTIPH